jgi:diguanylate cyclase (GGDEF)-like protein
MDSNRRSQLQLGALTETIHDLEAAPFSADPAFNFGPDARSPRLPKIVKDEIAADEAKLLAALSSASKAGAQGTTVAAGRASMARVKPAAEQVFALADAPGGLAVATPQTIAAAEGSFTLHLRAVSSTFDRLAEADAASARRAHKQADAGIVVTMLLLLVVFGYFYFRSQRLGRENEALLGLSREEASTDVLTGLGNRRALVDDLSSAIARQAPGGHELLVAMFDLNGFKQYNDTFGHGAGDALLARLGERLAVVVNPSGSAYRMGGDEFCLLARVSPQAAEGLLSAAAAALADEGEGWSIDCSYGATWIPSEAGTPSDALRNADRRMYSNKASRSSASRQLTDVLLRVLSEQDKRFDAHAGQVAELAGRVAEVLGQPEHEVRRVRLAAQLHDIGQTAVPRTVLNKPGPLDAHDWEFMHGHTLVGERIVLAAPALAHTAPLIRSSHERIDGAGYPDGLAGEQIPIGARIIAVCDAFDAMTSDRPYRAATTTEAALTELARCAGSQFDPEVVQVFSAIFERAASQAETAAQPRTTSP